MGSDTHTYDAEGKLVWSELRAAICDIRNVSNHKYTRQNKYEKN